MNMSDYQKEILSQGDVQEKRVGVITECQQRWVKKTCRGCRFFHRPLFPVTIYDNHKRCSQWDIIHNWREKQQHTR